MRLASNNNLRVLCYHRIIDPGEEESLSLSLISATPAGFRQQMEHVARHYQVVSLIDVINCLREGTALPARAMLITFDDAYRDFAEHAWPVLRRFQLPVTLFVPTALPGRVFWWDRLDRALASSSSQTCRTPIGIFPLRTREQRQYAFQAIRDRVKTLPHAEAMSLVDDVCGELSNTSVSCAAVLAWDELRQLAAEGVTLASHSRTHPLMVKISAEQMREEVIGSLEDLYREIGFALPVFCYPNGYHDDKVVRVLRELGMKLAFTTLDGHNHLLQVDPLRLCRTVITLRTTFPIFCVRLLRLAAMADRLRHRTWRAPQVAG